MSAIHLLWASLGAGKTHALYYLMNNMGAPDTFLPIYSEYPESPASFVEIYGGLARRIQWDQIAEHCLHVFAETDDTSLAPIRLVQPDIYRAFFLLAEGEDKAKGRLAMRWLRGETLTRTELRVSALTTNLDSPGDCAGVISVLAKLLGLKHRTQSGLRPFRIVWIIDECQRLGNASKRVNHEVNAGLQSTFNATPDNLTMILSFTGKPEKSLPNWLRPELADRIGAKNLILLPPLSRDEAKVFLRDLLTHFRTTGAIAERFFPFTERCVDLMLSRLLRTDINALGLGDLVEADGIRPRALIKCCGAVLQEHVERGESLPISEQFAATVLPK